MARRFKFFEKFHHFIYNSGVGYKSISGSDSTPGIQYRPETQSSSKPVIQYTNTILMGKTLIEAMLKEVDSMIQQESDNCIWSDAVHEQVCGCIITLMPLIIIIIIVI